MDACTVGGGDLALAAEVFRKYDEDGSGKLDRDELLAALRDLGLLQRVSAAAAGRTLAEMDVNHDGVVSWDEFREAFGRLAKLKAAEARAARVRQAVPPVPPNAATDPRLKAAFAAAAAYGAAKALGDRAERADGLTSRQFQRACTAAALPVERAAADVVFTVARKGAKLLSFPRFLEALALVSAESCMSLEQVLDAVRATAPATAASPCKAVDSRLPLSARAKGRPRSASPSPAPPAGEGKPAAGASDSRAASPAPKPLPATTAPAAGAAAVPAPATAASNFNSTKLEQGLAALQQLLESGPDGDDAILAHVPDGSSVGAPTTAGAVLAPAADLLENPHSNPAYRASEPGDGGDLGAFRLQLLSLLDKRCAAAEASCAAMVGTRSAFTAELQRALGAAGQHEEVAAAVRGCEARLAALEQRVDEGLRAAAADCRAAVAAAEARLEAQRRAQEEALSRVNQALLAIARKVGGLVAAGAAAAQ